MIDPAADRLIARLQARYDQADQKVRRVKGEERELWRARRYGVHLCLRDALAERA